MTILLLFLIVTTYTTDGRRTRGIFSMMTNWTLQEANEQMPDFVRQIINAILNHTRTITESNGPATEPRDDAQHILKEVEAYLKGKGIELEAHLSEKESELEVKVKNIAKEAWARKDEVMGDIKNIVEGALNSETLTKLVDTLGDLEDCLENLSGPMEGLESSMKDFGPTLQEMSEKMGNINNISDQMGQLTPVLKEVSQEMANLNDRVGSIIWGISVAVFFLAGLFAVILFFNLWGRFFRKTDRNFRELQRMHAQGRLHAKNLKAYEALEELLQFINNKEEVMPPTYLVQNKRYGVPHSYRY